MNNDNEFLQTSTIFMLSNIILEYILEYENDPEVMIKSLPLTFVSLCKKFEIPKLEFNEFLKEMNKRYPNEF